MDEGRKDDDADCEETDAVTANGEGTVTTSQDRRVSTSKADGSTDADIALGEEARADGGNGDDRVDALASLTTGYVRGEVEESSPSPGVITDGDGEEGSANGSSAHGESKFGRMTDVVDRHDVAGAEGSQGVGSDGAQHEALTIAPETPPLNGGGDTVVARRTSDPADSIEGRDVPLEDEGPSAPKGEVVPAALEVATDGIDVRGDVSDADHTSDGPVVTAVAVGAAEEPSGDDVKTTPPFDDEKKGDGIATTPQPSDIVAGCDGQIESPPAAAEGGEADRMFDETMPAAAVAATDRRIDGGGEGRSDANHNHDHPSGRAAGEEKEDASDGEGEAHGEDPPVSIATGDVPEDRGETVMIPPGEPSDSLSPLSVDGDDASKAAWATIASPDVCSDDFEPARGGEQLSSIDHSVVTNGKYDEKNAGPEVIDAAEPPASPDIARTDEIPGSGQFAAAATMPDDHDDDPTKASAKSQQRGTPGAFPVAGIRARERMMGQGDDHHHHESDRGIGEAPSPVFSSDLPADGGGVPITATPVEEPVYAAAVATPVDVDEEERQRSTKDGILVDKRFACRLGVAVAVAILVILAVTVPLVLLRDDGTGPSTPAPAPQPAVPRSDRPSDPPSTIPSTTPSSAPTASPTTERLSAVVDFVLDRNISTVEALLEDLNSPQRKAADWVANVDPSAVALTGDGGDETSVVQRYALAVLYYSTGGEEEWYDRESFLTGVNECEWGGDANWLGCDEGRTIFGLSIHYNRLRGTIPHELASLSELTYLSLIGNSLFGPIPSSLGPSLTNLTALRLRSNDLTGEIPPSLGGLTNLREMELEVNDLTGTIPTTFGRLTNLEMLTLSENELSGDLPSEMGAMTSLTELEMDGMRRLGGTLPSLMGNLVNLESLILDGRVGGSLPSEFGLMTSLVVMDVRRNDINGTIPRQLGDLTMLEELRLSMNDLTGPIPLELGLLTALRVLSLAGNELTGVVGDFLGSLVGNGTLASADIYLHNNDLTGSAEFICGSIGGGTLTVDLREIECSCCICCPCRPGEDCSLDVRF